MRVGRATMLIALSVLGACGSSLAPSSTPSAGASASIWPALARASPPPIASTSPRRATPSPVPDLTPSPSARAIGSAFTFKDGERWMLGYNESRAFANAVVVLPDGAAPVSFAVPNVQKILNPTYVDRLHGWALGRVESFGPLPNCQHAGSRCDDVILATVDGGRTWSIVRSVYSTGVTGYTFHGLQFIDARRGWTVQYLDSCSSPCQADLLATEDGGATWTVRSSAAPGRVFDAVRFVDATWGWAVETDWWTYFGASGRATRLLATADGGRTWTPQLDGVGVYGITALDRSHAWAIAREIGCGPGCPIPPTQLYKTTDGEHWSKVIDNFDPSGCVGANLFRPTFLDANRGLITSGGLSLGDRGGVLSSKDGGSTWSCASEQPRPANARQQALIYSASFVVVTRDIEGSDHLIVTADLGATWTERDLPRF